MAHTEVMLPKIKHRQNRLRFPLVRSTWSCTCDDYRTEINDGVDGVIAKVAEGTMHW